MGVREMQERVYVQEQCISVFLNNLDNKTTPANYFIIRWEGINLTQIKLK